MSTSDGTVTTRSRSATRVAELIPPDSRVLDLSCGEGRLARALVQRGCVVVGVTSDAAEAKAAQVVCERVLVADLDRIDLDVEIMDDHFDVVVADGLLQLAKDPARLLSGLAVVLRPSGYLVVTNPNVAAERHRLSLVRGVFPLEARTYSTRSVLVDLVERAGWSVVRVEGIVQAGRVPDTSGVGLDVLRMIADDPEARVEEHILVAFPGPPENLHPLMALLQTLSDHGEDTARATEAALSVALHGLASARQELAEEQHRVAHHEESAYVAGLERQDLRLRLDRERHRLLDELGEVRRLLVDNGREAAARRRTQRRRWRKRYDAAIGLERDRLAVVSAERDDLALRLVAIEGSRWWTAATVCRRGLSLIRERAR